MQIKITLSPKTEFLMPLNYNYQLQSSIYSMLRENPQYADFLHDKGFGSEKTMYRMFTFGAVNGSYMFLNGKLAIKGNIKFEVRSPSIDFCSIFERSLLMRDTLKLFDNELEIRQVELDDYHVEQNKVNIVTVSPIAARFNVQDGSTIYYSPEQEEFSKLICRNLIAKYSAYTGRNDENVSFRYTGNSKKVVTRYKNIWITAYHLNAEISGTPELLDFAYQTGLGSRSAQGFGMFETV